MERVRETFLTLGLILFITGIIIFLAYNPTYTTISNRLAGYETGSISKSDFEFYTLLNTTVMPILNILIAIGVTLMLLGVFTKEKK